MYLPRRMRIFTSHASHVPRHLRSFLLLFLSPHKHVLTYIRALTYIYIHTQDTGEILGVHIIGLHAADLIHEASNAIATRQTVNDIKFNVHAHPTLSEVLDELFKQAHTEKVPAAAAKKAVATA